MRDKAFGLSVHEDCKCMAKNSIHSHFINLCPNFVSKCVNQPR